MATPPGLRKSRVSTGIRKALKFRVSFYRLSARCWITSCWGTRSIIHRCSTRYRRMGCRRIIWEWSSRVKGFRRRSTSRSWGLRLRRTRSLRRFILRRCEVLLRSRVSRKTRFWMIRLQWGKLQLMICISERHWCKRRLLIGTRCPVRLRREMMMRL